MTFAPRFGRLVVAAGALALVALAAAQVIAADHAVGIVDKTFDPAEITVTAGDTATWTVTKSIGEPHSVTSGKPGDADAGSGFDSGITLKDDGQSYQHTFDTPGTFDYFCVVHPVEMTGVVTVLAAGESAAPAGSEPPASATPAASETPSGSAAPEGSAGPEASQGPSPEHTTPVPVQDRMVAAGILIVAIVLLFGAAAVWRRVNRA